MDYESKLESLTRESLMATFAKTSLIDLILRCSSLDAINTLSVLQKENLTAESGEVCRKKLESR